MPPKVSIVIPCYNREKYLGLAIQSVLDQTFTNFELIICDDGSTDSEQNQGVAFALKKGFDIAQGEFIGQVDSDDLLESEALRLTVQALESDPGLGMVYTNYIDIDADGNKLKVGARCSTPYSREGLLTHFMTFHFRLMRKSAYQKVGGVNAKFNTIEDYELCLRLSEVARIAKVNDFLYLYRSHSDSIKSNSSLPMLVLTCKAVREALRRRGMDETHKIIIKNPQFEIVEKQGIEYFKSQYQPEYPPPPEVGV
jgi:glycosyltransferase involved in cell wall biosynthesis